MLRETTRIRQLTLIALLGAVIGAAVLAVALLAAGAIGGRARAASPVSEVDLPSSATSLAAPLSAARIYAAANPSVVDITSRHPGSIDTGTGFAIDSQGHVLTADHVVAGASSVTVKFQNGTTVPADVLGQDGSTDVAVLKVNPSAGRLPALALGTTTPLMVGDTLAVIGNPFGYNRSLSTGVVSALDRTIQAPNGWLIPHALQTDAPINPGNSGGPVLDAQGSVVGIVDQIATGGSDIDSDTGVGFAIPIDLVKAELSQLERGADVAHAYLGIATGQSDSSKPGALVEAVAPASPAAQAGLRANDLIVAVEGTAIQGPSALIAAVAAHKPGEKLTLRVRRGSRVLELTATLSKQPRKPPIS